MLVRAEYIWLDGSTPTQGLRSKTKIFKYVGDDMDELLKTENVPVWGFDGSSTKQALGNFSDCKLRPVRVVFDPLRSQQFAINLLVMCDVLNPDDSPHKSNTRVHLERAVRKYQEDVQSWVAFEQEYTLFRLNGTPLGFNADGSKPRKQGPYYCGVGADKIFGRNLVEDHAEACLQAGLFTDGCGTNAEVMPGQWEFQLMAKDPLLCADNLHLARWLLHKLGEKIGVVVSLDPKPVSGNWNGAGMHTNFSTEGTRNQGGLEVIKTMCSALARYHKAHIGVYGAGNKRRLTGKHETCPITKFRANEYDRGASIRIPMATVEAGKGYLEDRRPAANADPYLVLTAHLETCCGDGFRGAESLGLKPQTVI